MSSPVISVEDLGKKYVIRHKSNGHSRWNYSRLSDDIIAAVKTPFRALGVNGHAKMGSEEFWALRNVSFEVNQGEVLGVIGRNGAGKSTLLKILSRITELTEGRVRLRGRVASLLEVGTGFHPELSGRENIYLNGAILGMGRAEIKNKFDEIVAFAEVEKFLDTPVKRYSSGMYVRLAFAVAAHMDPEILLVDEVLAVGDAAFQRKCLGKMSDVCGSGRTIIFVSHNMQVIRQLCRSVLWLDKGCVRELAVSEDAVGHYLAAETKTDSIAELNDHLASIPSDPAFRLNRVDVRQDGVSTTSLLSGKPVEIQLNYEVLQEAYGLHIYFMLCDMDGTLIFESLHNGASGEHLPLVNRGSYVSTAIIPADFLAGRNYELQIQAGIHCLRGFFRTPLAVRLQVLNAGLVNRAYAGYDTPGKLAPLIPWDTKRL